MRKLFIAVSLLFCLGAQAQTDPKEWQHLLIPMQYHGDEAPIHPGTGWFALIAVGGVWRLEPAIVRSKRVFDPVLDAEDQKTGLEISSNQEGTIALLRFDGIKGGKVDTPDMKFNNEEELYPKIGKPPLKISFKKIEYRLEAFPSGLHLKSGSKASSLSDTKFDGLSDDFASLLWAGDLDRDGKLDLLISYNGDNWYSVCLYLSSGASEGGLVQPMGCHMGIGC